MHYLSGGNGLFGIYIDNSAKADSLCFAFTDYQGNLAAAAVSNQLIRRYAYDPWGNRRNASDWTQADTAGNLFISRGYTMHEHLDRFKLINMNGRMYDPVLAAFLSPDPFVQMPDNWLNYNRYSYCFGNPLKYTDPTGEQQLTSSNEFVHWAEAANPGNWLNNDHLTYLERLCKDNGIKLTVYSGNDLPPLRGFNHNPAAAGTPTPGVASNTTSESKEVEIIPTNPLVTASVNSSNTLNGEAKLLNVDNKTALTVTSGSITTTTEYQVNGLIAGASAYGGGSADGSLTGGLSVSVGPVQIGVSGTGSPDIINSSINVNIDMNYTRANSVGASVGVKPIGIAVSVVTAILNRIPIIPKPIFAPASTVPVSPLNIKY